MRDTLEAKKYHDDENHAILALSDDNVSAWKVLLYTFISGDLPPMYYRGSWGEPDLDDLTELLTESWILGDKYKIVELQDLIMAELLQILAGRVVMPKGVIAAARRAHPESKIHELMASAMADRLQAHGHFNPTVTSCLGYDGIPQHFIDTANGINISDIPWGADMYNSKPGCMHYMMDGGPRTYWLYVLGPFYSSHDDSEDDATESEEGS